MDISDVSVVPHLGGTFKATIGTFEKDGYQVVAFGDTEMAALYALSDRLGRFRMTVGGALEALMRTKHGVPAIPYEVVRRLLNYSLEPVGFEYASLSEAERKLVSPEEFERLKVWVLSPGPEHTKG